MEDKTDFEAYLLKLHNDLNILREREAKYAGMAPLALLHEIADYEQAIALTDAAKNGDLSKEDWLEKLQPLLVESDPIRKVLQVNLQDNFEEPIRRLNEDTRMMWQKTILYAQYGFLARIWMSIAVFIVGLLLFTVSSWQITFGNLKPEELFGPGVSFVGGLAAMIAVIYTGPLKEIRKSVNDLGIASAAFIAYIHRVLEISHTFSFYYLRDRITFEEMNKSSLLIQEAMDSTIDKLGLATVALGSNGRFVKDTMAAITNTSIEGDTMDVKVHDS